MKSLKVSVVGLGYLGATQAIVLASKGFDVIGIDLDEHRVSDLNEGNLPFFEPGLADLYEFALQSGKLRFVSTYTEDLAAVDVHFICVGTPLAEDGLGIDISHVVNAAVSIADHAKPDSVLVGRSTVPVGTAQKIKEMLEETSKGALKLAWNPEFLSEGTAVRDFLKPDRIVVGVEDELSRKLLSQVYEDFVDEGRPFLSMSLASAELAKVAANSFLAMKVSFINGVASVAEVSGASTRELSLALGMDSRIGGKYLANGLGFGGGCLPKDLSGFADFAQRIGSTAFANMLNNVATVNANRVDATVAILNELTLGISKPVIAVLGAAFKADTDDLRNSPSIFLVEKLRESGFTVKVHDPKAGSSSNGADISNNINAVVAGAQALVVATNWLEYKTLNPKSLEGLVSRKVIVDARGVIDSGTWATQGWKVLRLGEGQDFAK